MVSHAASGMGIAQARAPATESLQSQSISSVKPKRHMCVSPCQKQQGCECGKAPKDMEPLCSSDVLVFHLATASAPYM